MVLQSIGGTRWNRNLHLMPCTNCTFPFIFKAGQLKNFLTPSPCKRHVVTPSLLTLCLAGGGGVERKI